MLKLVVEAASEYYSVVNDGNIDSSGRLTPGAHVWGQASTDIVHAQSENEYLAEINAIGTVNDPLPPAGTELEAGIVYAWNGQNVIVRQKHIRTFHDPDTVPALFLFYRADGGDLEWIANEEVMKGDIRTHDGTKYEVITGHATVVGHTPDLTPALWNVVQEGEWPDWVQPAGAHDAYQTGDQVTHNAKRWVSDINNNVWAPGVYGWTEVA